MRLICRETNQTVFIVCFAILFIAKYATAAQVSLCDYWPHKAGNNWFARYPDEYFDQRFSFDEEFEVNGYCVWKTLEGIMGDFSYPKVLYRVFMDDWLYITNNQADLVQLPNITGDLKRFLPLTISLDESFFSPYLNEAITPRMASLFEFFPERGIRLLGGDLRLFPFGNQPDVLVFMSQPGQNFPLFGLGKGLGVLFYAWFVIDTITVLGGCDSSLAITRPPVGGRHEEGSRLELSVEVAGKSGGLLYQWIRNGIYATGQTGSVYTIEALGFGDAGRYSCIVSNPGKGSVQTLPVEISVVEAGTLPAAGLSGLATLTLAIGGLAAFRRAR